MVSNEEREEYIRLQNIFLNDNIDEFEVGDKIIDLDGRETKITGKYRNSLEVFIEAKDKHVKYEYRKGISYKQWFYIKDFNKRFNKLK